MIHSFEVAWHSFAPRGWRRQPSTAPGERVLVIDWAGVIGDREPCFDALEITRETGYSARYHRRASRIVTDQEYSPAG
jgi:hypothetical protein